jgi:hypothetical protein
MKESSCGIGFILFLVFLILKLCGVITWSWLWITAPVWIPVALIMIFALITIILYFLSKRK